MNGSNISAKKKADAKSTGRNVATTVSKKHLIVPPKPSRDYNSYISPASKKRVNKILVAQPQPAALKSPYFDIEKKYGVKVSFLPFVNVIGISANDFRKQRINIGEYNGVIFTSQQAIDHYFRLCEETRVKVSQEMKFFCTSEAIALYLQKYTQYRKRKVFFGDSSANKELRNLIVKHRETTRFLYVTSEAKAVNEITSFMMENKIQFAEGVMYKTVPSDLSGLKLKDYDMVLLFSPNAVTSLLQQFPLFKEKGIRVGVYGRTTADAIISGETEMHLMAPLNQITSIVVALEKYLAEFNK
ncbi:MAG TPA: uroporphyrinogen-III synthase [Chitinophagales bacterium]